VIFYLLAGRETAGMSLKHMYLVHPDSADKQAISRERRGCDTAAFHSVSVYREDAEIFKGETILL
jgi:hypothetical protein